MRRVGRGRPRRLHVVDVFSSIPILFSLIAREKKGEYSSKLSISIGQNKMEHTFAADDSISDLGKKINELMSNRCTVRIYRESRARKINTLQSVKDFKIDPKNALRIRPSSNFVGSDPIRFKALIEGDENKGDFGDDDAIAQALINAGAHEPTTTGGIAKADDSGSSDDET